MASWGTIGDRIKIENRNKENNDVNDFRFRRDNTAECIQFNERDFFMATQS